MTRFESALPDCDGIGAREARGAVKSIDAALGETLLPPRRHGIGKGPLESDQVFPVDAELAGNPTAVHAARDVACLRAADQHFLGIAAAQGAGAAERPIIAHSARATRLAS